MQGTGATFPAPLYQKWFTEYNKLHPDVQINYQALGSGAGIKQFQQHLVDFGASDAAMTDEEMAAVQRGRSVAPDDCRRDRASPTTFPMGRAS